MDWLKDILIFLIGFMCGYLVRRSMELEFHIECTDDGDDRWKSYRLISGLAQLVY